jgi:hypothetical protein
MSINLKRLAEKFSDEDVEWRLGQAGGKGNGLWALCMPYIQSRAIMDRLDEVCGPENWKVEYRVERGHEGGQNVPGFVPGVVARIGIKIGDEWVFKEDGAEQTDIESFKGGISGALKRAGVAWGIGRYLYKIEACFAEVSTSPKPGWSKGQTKDRETFWWTPPHSAGASTPPTSAPPASQAKAPAPAAKKSEPPKETDKPLSRAELAVEIVKIARSKNISNEKLEELATEMFKVKKLEDLSTAQMGKLYKEIA